MISWTWLVIVVFSLTKSYATADEDELLSVITIFRHGDRNPIRFYPKDPYQYSLSLWEEGLGELTNQGKERHYKLGKWFRKRYKHFLPEEYSPQDVYIRSSDIDRSIMSAGAHLAGLFPPKHRQIWDSDLLWQPMPIHTVPYSDDNLAAMAKPCAKHKILQEQLVQSEEFRIIAKLNADLYAYISEHAGINGASFMESMLLYDTLLIEHGQRHLNLPVWAHPIYPGRLEDLAITAMSLDSYTPALARLKSGPLIDYINTNFQKIVANASDQGAHKYVIVSAHDITILNVLNALNIYESHLPVYSSTLIFELRRDARKTVYVNILYKKDADPEAQQEPIRLTLNGCKFNCALNTFRELTAPVSLSPDQWERECQADKMLQ